MQSMTYQDMSIVDGSLSIIWSCVTCKEADMLRTCHSVITARYYVVKTVMCQFDILLLLMS